MSKIKNYYHDVIINMNNNDDYESLIHYSINDFIDLIETVGTTASFDMLFSELGRRDMPLTEVERIKMIDMLSQWEY
jgi:hypothetical protein